MRLLLDTHIYLWWIEGASSFSSTTRSLILNAAEVYISSASIWEIAIKVRLGKLNAKMDKLIGAMEDSGFSELPITVKHAAVVYSLPAIHHDPFDRILIAQAMSEPLKLLTADKKLQEYSDLVEIVSGKSN